MTFDAFLQQLPDADPDETEEWLESLDNLLATEGASRARYVIGKLLARAKHLQIGIPPMVRPPSSTPSRPRRSRGSPVTRRWSGASAGSCAGTRRSWSPGPTRSTTASAATSPPMRPRPPSTRSASTTSSGARTTARRATRSTTRATPRRGSTRAPTSRAGSPRTSSTTSAARRRASGLSSYPHPRLMPEFWEFPTVSMGIGPLNAIYQARFNRYLYNRHWWTPRGSRVWSFLGDGECDEPEALGALSLAAREWLDNLIFVDLLQPAAAGRAGAGQRQDHPGVGVDLPRRGLERRQGHLGRASGTRCSPRTSTASSSIR